MTFSFEIDAELNDFSGLAPIFPLPSVVLFPHALLPLHIFESRYRQMTADALDGERLIAMALMKPGSGIPFSVSKPPIYQTMGLGKIIAHEKLDDGRYYIVLRGIARIKLLSEPPSDLPYRMGQFEICQEFQDAAPKYPRQERAEELVSLFGELFPEVKIQQLFASSVSELPLRTVCDILLGSIQLAPEHSQQFLDELNVDSRSERLLNLLQQAMQMRKKSANRTFPPEFSSN